MEEIWKDIDGYDGFYKISNFGRIKSLYRNKETILKPQIVANYYMIQLYKNGVGKHRTIHSLVAESFVDGWFENAEINHKDLNKLNNKCDNLEWVTRSGNQQHQYYKYHPDYKVPRCSNCGNVVSNRNVILCNECIKNERRKNWPSKETVSNDLLTMNFTQLGDKYGCSDNMVRKICRAYCLPDNRNKVIEYRKLS